MEWLCFVPLFYVPSGRKEQMQYLPAQKGGTPQSNI